MNKKLLSVLILLIGTTSFAQSFEFGPKIGYKFNNIVDRKSDQKRAVIGDALWNVDYGVQAVYNFRKPNEKLNVRLTAFYNNQKRGSKSERYSDHEFNFNTNSVGLMVGASREFASNWIFSFNGGISYNKMKIDNFYKGNMPQQIAFEDLKEDLVPKDNDISFVFNFIFERVLIPNKLNGFVELYGDAGISKMNTSYGSLGNQGFGAAVGVKYTIDFTKYE